MMKPGDPLQYIKLPIYSNADKAIMTIEVILYK